MCVCSMTLCVHDWGGVQCVCACSESVCRVCAHVVCVRVMYVHVVCVRVVCVCVCVFGVCTCSICASNVCVSVCVCVCVKWVCAMSVKRKVRYSSLFTNLVRWHAGAVSFPLSDVILAQLACPLSDVMF